MHRRLAVALATFPTLAVVGFSGTARAGASAVTPGGQAEVSLAVRAAPGTPFLDGDRLVPRRLGLVDWYHGDRLLATLGDPEGLVAAGRDVDTSRLLLVDASGRPVHELAADRALFLRAGPPARIFYRRGHRKPPPPDPSLLMTYHGGYVMSASSTVAIFWGPEWTDAGFAGDKVAGVDSFLAGFGGSVYARTLNEYAVGGAVAQSASTYEGHTFDTTQPPANALTPLEVTEEACKIAGNHPDPGTVYFVYGSPRLAQLDFCAYHTAWTCSHGGAPVQVAYVPNLDGFRGCDIRDTQTRHSEGLSAIANATAHELAETITDPQLDAWYQDDPGGGIGEEVADKCAYAFPRRATRLANGSSWKIQMLWSNAAYLAGRGQPNYFGQLGCK
jgi:hypothetical protein